MEIIGYLASVFIGISLGLIGGGGSILALPILVYLFKVPPEQATTYSLFIVGLTSILGAFTNYRLGNLKIKFALLFGIPSVISLLIMREIFMPIMPESLFTIGHLEVTKNVLILVVFAFLMIATSFSMIRNSNNSNSSHQPNTVMLLLIGSLVGFLIGFLGAGGGFLIIPALLYFANLPIKQAVGTSLFIIFINSLIGFSTDLMGGVTLNVSLLLGISLMAILGLFIGSYLSKKIDGSQLKPIFGWFILLMGVYIITKELLLT